MVAQNGVPSKSDSVYTKIEQVSQKKKFYKFLHKVLFRSVDASEISNKKRQNSASITSIPYSNYNCKIIRTITIETLDPFGFSAENKNSIPTNKFEKIGNSLHIKTKNWTIRNLLLFNKNEELDSLLIKETERLIRGQRFVRSVKILPVAIPNCKDSIDVSIRVLDTWSAAITGAYANNISNFDINERNFIGLGHEFDINYLKSLDNSTANNYGYDSKYTIPNVLNTFINTSVASKKDLYNNTYKSIKVDRPFYSTFTHWAGGMYFDYKSFNQTLFDQNSTAVTQNFNTNSYSFWGGRAFNVFGKKSEISKTSHLVVTAGFTNSNYQTKPDLTLDPLQYFSSSKLAIATIGISTQKFYQDKYLFRFGTVEDIPYGKVISFTGGFENKNTINRAYFGGRIAYGNYFNFGYLQGNFETGSFFNNGKSEQSIYKFELNYFTNLFPIGSWKFRQFFKPVLVLGTNRINTIQDRLNLIDVNGIPGFNSAPLTGTKKFLATFQTQSYNQKEWYGFNFSPYINFTLGFLDQGDHIFFSNKMYSQIGVGVLVNNNYLVFNSFQLSFSYYPSLPIEGSNIIKTNAFQNNNIEFRDFQIGQPALIPYQ
jgi:hypothetical protein